MSETTSSSSEQYDGRVYEGVWRVLATCFRVPRLPPELPRQADEVIATRRPASGFLTYIRVSLFVQIAFLIIAAMVGMIVLAIQMPVLALILLLPVIALIVTFVMIGLLATRLRYDTTWYVFSDRSMRLRRGIWLIRETTITFENIQNVQTRQGPLQRFFGIADVIVETAGGGTTPQGASANGHNGLIEGIENAQMLRDAIREKIGASRTTGVGDDDDGLLAVNKPAGFQPQHIAVLKEIDQLLR